MGAGMDDMLGGSVFTACQLQCNDAQCTPVTSNGFESIPHAAFLTEPSLGLKSKAPFPWVQNHDISQPNSRCHHPFSCVSAIMLSMPAPWAGAPTNGHLTSVPDILLWCNQLIPETQQWSVLHGLLLRSQHQGFCTRTSLFHDTLQRAATRACSIFGRTSNLKSATIQVLWWAKSMLWLSCRPTLASSGHLAGVVCEEGWFTPGMGGLCKVLQVAAPCNPLQV